MIVFVMHGAYVGNRHERCGPGLVPGLSVGQFAQYVEVTGVSGSSR